MCKSTEIQVQKKNRTSFLFFWIFANIVGFSAIYYFPTNWFINLINHRIKSEMVIVYLIWSLITCLLFSFCQFLFIITFKQKKAALRWFLVTSIAIFLTNIITTVVLGVFFAKILFPVTISKFTGLSYYYRFILSVQVTVKGDTLVKVLAILFLSIYFSIGIGPLIGFLQGSLFLRKESTIKWIVIITISTFVGLSINSFITSFIPNLSRLYFLYAIVMGTSYGILTSKTLQEIEF